MRRAIGLWGIVLSALLLMSAVPSSWAWVRIGFRGPGVGVYLAPGPWWGYGYYDPYYDVPADPYYYPYAYRSYRIPLCL